MMFRALILTSVLAAVNAQCPDVPADGCSVCGDDLCVTNFDAIFTFPNQPSAPCGQLQEAGYTGLIPLANCPFLPGLIGVCECGVVQLTDAPVTAAPVTPAPVTPAPIAPTPAPTDPPATDCPAVPAGGCSVCGEGLCVQAPDAIFEFPDQPTTDCGTLEFAGESGLISADQCPFLPGIIGVCECGTPTPVTPAPVTPAPVDPPTPAPVAPPTPAPVAPPTDAPTVAPTPVPIEVSPIAPTPFPIFILTPQPTPTDEMPPGDDDDDDEEEGKMGMGMGMGMGKGKGGMMSMAMKRRTLVETGIRAGTRGTN